MSDADNSFTFDLSQLGDDDITHALLYIATTAPIDYSGWSPKGPGIRQLEQAIGLLGDEQLQRWYRRNKRGLLGALINIYTIGATDRPLELAKMFGLGAVSRLHCAEYHTKVSHRKEKMDLIKRCVKAELSRRGV